MSAEWPEVRLEDITSILGDGLHGTPVYDASGEYFFINGNNLRNGKIEVDSQTKRTSKQEFLKHRKKLNDRTILVSINGTIGNVGLYNGENVILGKSACYFNVLEDVDKQFVRYVITSNKFQDYINSLATGSTIKNVSLKLMRNFTFRLPPIKIQKNISKVLENLDSKIELNRQINQTLEEIAQTIFKSWFVDFEPVKAKIEAKAAGRARQDGERSGYQKKPLDVASDVTWPEAVAGAIAKGDPERAAMCAISGKLESELDQLSPAQYQQLAATAALFPDELVAHSTCSGQASELGLIPVGWEVKSISDISKFATGKVNVSALSIENYISTENMQENREGVSCATSLPTVSTVPHFSIGHVLISNIRPYFKKIWLARFDGGRSNDVLSFESSEKDCIEFLYNLLYQDDFFDFMMRTSKGAKMPRGDKDAIAGWKFACAGHALRSSFSEKVRPFYSYIESLNAEVQQLSLTRDTLLPKLLSGELAVETAHNEATSC